MVLEVVLVCVPDLEELLECVSLEVPLIDSVGVKLELPLEVNEREKVLLAVGVIVSRDVTELVRLEELCEDSDFEGVRV